MAINLRNSSKKKLDDFKDKFIEGSLTVQEECLKSIAESLLILAEKIGRKLP